MTNIEVIVLVGGLILLLIVCLVALQQGRPDLANAPAANPNWDAAAAAVWNQRLQGASDDFGLGASQNSSKIWGAAITTLLGVFASVAVVKGPDTLTDLPTNLGTRGGLDCPAFPRDSRDRRTASDHRRAGGPELGDGS